MKNASQSGNAKTHAQLRTMRSLRISTGPGRATWPRLQETERLQGQPRLNLRRPLNAWPQITRRPPHAL